MPLAVTVSLHLSCLGNGGTFLLRATVYLQSTTTTSIKLLIATLSIQTLDTTHIILNVYRPELKKGNKIQWGIQHEIIDSY